MLVVVEVVVVVIVVVVVVVAIAMKKALRETQTLRALAVVRFAHRPLAVTNPQTGPITIHCAAAS